MSLIFYSKHSLLWQSAEPLKLFYSQPHKTKRKKKGLCELVSIHIKGELHLFSLILEFKVSTTEAVTNGGRVVKGMMFRELCWRNSQAWGSEESLKSCLLLWCCVYVCMPLDITSHASFPMNLRASGWMSRVWTLFSHSLPPSLIPRGSLLECSAPPGISPGRTSSRGGPPHILCTGHSSSSQLLSHCPLSPEAILQLPAFVNCGLPPRVPSSHSRPSFQPPE